VVLGRTAWGRRGFREDEVHALLDRLAGEVASWSREVDLLLRENDRIKDALRTWQSEHASHPRTR
jgi:cell division septum initiation protein DivIVA